MMVVCGVFDSSLMQRDPTKSSVAGAAAAGRAGEEVPHGRRQTNADYKLNGGGIRLLMTPY